MATEILIPKIGFAMEEGTLAEWMFADGDEVKEGEVLYLLESDKSANEVDSPASGKLKVLKEEGEVYKVGTVIGLIE